MASSKVETVEVKPAVPAVVEKNIVLNLTEDEASVLLAILGRVAGEDPQYSIYLALLETGVPRRHRVNLTPSGTIRVGRA